MQKVALQLVNSDHSLPSNNFAQIQKKISDPVEEAFEHWKAILDYPRARLDDKRRKCIAARLADGYTLADLTDAINGCYLSEFHQGDNEHNRRYDDITLICRDAEHIDRFIQQFEEAEIILQRIENTPTPATDQPFDRDKARERLAAMKRVARR